MEDSNKPTFKQKINIFIYGILRDIAVKVFSIMPLKKNKIIFDNFAGKGYADNPKYIANELLNRQLDLDLVWLLNDMEQILPVGIRKVKYNSIKSLYEYATAKVIVDNIRNSHLMKKRNGQIYLQTWHGSKPLKYIEKDAENSLSVKYIEEAKYDGSITDGIIIDSKMQEDIIKRAFYLNPNVEFLRYGLPCNDVLIRNKENLKFRQKIRNKLNVSNDDFIVLYAPTFRDNNSTEFYITDYDKLIEKFEDTFNKNCVFWVRMHPNVKSSVLEIKFNDKVKDVSYYPDTQELVLAADCLISDYSSVMFDFLLLRKIVFLYSPDIEMYKKLRGLSEEYYNLPFLRGNNVEELLTCINSYNEEEYLIKVQNYLEKCTDYNYGNSAICVANWILNKMKYKGGEEL